MSFLELAQTRHSTRRYQSRQIEQDKLLRVLEAGRLAPSAVNFQPLHFVVLREESMRKMVAATYYLDWITEAPVIIAICCDHNRSWRRPDGKNHGDMDAAIAVDHMTLAAAEMGLGTCWVCGFDSMKCHKILKLPHHLEVMVLLPLGYPASQDDGRHETKRKDLEEMVHWDVFDRQKLRK